MTLWAAACLYQSGCEDEPRLPPRDQADRRVLSGVTAERAIQVHADRQFTITHLVFVVQADPLDSSRMGVSLTSAKRSPGEPRLIFGTFVRASSTAQLAQTEIHFAGSPLLNLGGSGIFTPLTAYQPKFATMKITEYDENEVHGALGGEFYRFRMATPIRRPDLIQVEATFVAKLLVR